MAPTLPIYMDNHSTTRVDPRVVEAMLPFFAETFGNAASRSHAFGWAAEAAVDQARETIAGMLGASPKEIVFTSGATESDNLAIKGVAEYYRGRGGHIVTTQIEHKAVLDSCKHLERQGFRVSYVAVAESGIVSPAAIQAALTDETILVSVMLANNEVGTVQPIEAIGRITRERGILFHCDAVQGFGRVPFDVGEMNVDLAALSAHKIHGPKGIGALYVRRSKPRVRLVAQVDGGGHERGMRSGTLNVPGIVGLARAAELLRDEGAEESTRIRRLRDRLRQHIVDGLDGVTLNGHAEERLPGNLNVSFAGVEAEALMLALRDVAVSSGSACTSASLEPSYVLRAMGVDDELAYSSIRFGLGRFNTEDEVDYVGRLVVDKVRHLRQISTRHLDDSPARA
jgi:cysteine desulfurase